MNMSESVDEDFVVECGDDSLLDKPLARYPIVALYVLVFCICLAGNLFTVAVIMIHPLMRTATNFFLANLAAADLLVAIFCILQNMIHIVGFDHGNWPLGEVLCKLYVMVLQLVPCTSVGILVCVSIEKYIAVLHPLTALKVLTKQRRIIVTVSIWIASFLMNIPYFFNTKLYRFGESAACGRAEPMRLWVTISFVFWYLLPLFLLAFIYTRIAILLWSAGSSGRPSNRQSTDSTTSASLAPGSSWQMANGRVVVYKQESLLQVPEDDQLKRRRKEIAEGRRKVVRLLFAVVLSFAVLTFPHHARLLHSMWTTSTICNNEWTILLQPLSYLSLFVSSMINPILYAFMSRRFRESVLDIIYCRKAFMMRIARSRNRTVVSDVPEDCHTPGCPTPQIRLMKLRPS